MSSLRPSSNVVDFALLGPLRRRVSRFKMLRKILRVKTIEERFEGIYRSNFWDSQETRSGPGSTISSTTKIRLTLPHLLEEFGFKSIFDAGCGDFNWIKSIIDELGLNYIGGDIVKDLVNENRRLWETNNVKFISHNICVDQFPRADLWICRDTLFHLSYEDGINALAKFCESEIGFVLITTHKPEDSWENRNIVSGDFRKLNMFASPYNFPTEVIYRFDDYAGEESPREMVLLSREQIQTLNWGEFRFLLEGRRPPL